MKLLLTSAGLSNQSIVNALFDLVGKKPQDTNLVVIPTASNIEIGDKSWLIDDLINLKNLNFKQIDIADISALEPEICQEKFEQADVLFFEGGNTYHLMNWLNRSGLTTILPKLLKDKVYVGVSAGSMVTSNDLALEISQIIYGDDLNETENMDGLGYVDFYVLPHLNSEYFPKVRKDNIEKTITGMVQKIYALDDNSAIKVIDGTVEIISEGVFYEFN
jgi:dipeptidase E